VSEPQPPVIPVGLLSFFAGQSDFSAMIGDLKEEFYQRYETSGPQAARRFFWREAFRTGLALTGREFSQSPVHTTLIAVAGFVFIGATAVLYAFLVQRSLVDLLYGPHGYITLVLLNIIPSLAAGWAGCRLLPGREWALALTFMLITVSTAVAGTIYFELVRRLGPAEVATFMATVCSLRLGFFSFGCLWMRGRSAFSSSKSIAE